VSPRKTHVADRHMPHLTPCGRQAEGARVSLAAAGAEPTCAWCLAYVRGAWGASGVVTPSSEPFP
jgi:hypothetical protein